MTVSDPYAAPSTIEARSVAAPAPAETDTEPVDPAAPNEESEVPADATIRDLLDWVDGDTDRAQRALDAEHERANPRKRAISDLEELLTSP